eukprot:m.118886 g.118886  ORF g.118886 m.118886 type:complete len:432 (-) comp28707_c0_seq1:151-1446(-)
MALVSFCYSIDSLASSLSDKVQLQSPPNTSSLLNRTIPSSISPHHPMSVRVGERVLFEYFSNVRSGSKLDDWSDEGLIDRKTPFKLSHGKSHFIITGGAGYIGSHAVLELLTRGHKVTVLDNLSRGNAKAIDALGDEAQPSQLAFYNVDIGDAVMLTAVLRHLALQREPVEIVIHFAAVSFVGESIHDPLLYYTNVTSNTANLLRAMKESNVTKFIYSSSCATYGNAKTMPITELTPQVPTSPYGHSKMMAERVVKDHAAANYIHAVILRYFNVIGSDPQGRIGESQHSEHAKLYPRISTACFEAAMGRRDQLEILGTDFNTADGTCVRDYIHVVDLVHAHLAAIKALSTPLSIFNVGVGQGYSVREFVDTCQNVTGTRIKVVEKPRRVGDPAMVYADSTKVRRDLDWTPAFTNLRDSLQTSWRWNQNPKY